ncbi:hypothetical protein, partial [Pseudomonas viridiflava]|uniref:hypothetical protein n=1 Tax=Pseudomonas viridiflava TaxID=33069 RepID=UPI0019D06DAB
ERWGAKVGFLVLNTTAPHPETEDWNFRGFQTRLADMQGSYAANIDHNRSALQVKNVITSTPLPDKQTEISITMTSGQQIWTLTLIAVPYGEYVWHLLSGSYLEARGT